MPNLTILFLVKYIAGEVNSKNTAGEALTVNFIKTKRENTVQRKHNKRSKVGQA